jgi:uncharacterized protein YdaU (DUF1376 family)
MGSVSERVDFFLPLYVRDFLTSTFGWTAEERGHYMVLLMLSWDRGGLPEDLASLERLSPGVTSCWGLLEGKFPVCDDGVRRNQRLEEHREKALKARLKRAEAGRKGGKRKALALLQQSSSNATAKPKQPEPEPEPTSSFQEEVGKQQQTPATPTGKSSSVTDAAWQMLRERWNAGSGAKWRSRRPPPEAVRAMGDDSWLEVALAAIDHLPKCKYFNAPVDLPLFCRPGFVDKVVGHAYDVKHGKGDDKPTASEVADRWERRSRERNPVVDEYVRVKHEKAARAAAATQGG